MKKKISCWREGEHEHDGEDIHIGRNRGVDADGLEVDGGFSSCGSGCGCDVV